MLDSMLDPTLKHTKPRFLWFFCILRNRKAPHQAPCRGRGCEGGSNGTPAALIKSSYALNPITLRLNSPKKAWSQWNVEIPETKPWLRAKGLFYMNGERDYCRKKQPTGSGWTPK